MIAMKAEFKLSINAYLADLVYSPVRTLAQVIAFNIAHPVEVNNHVDLFHFAISEWSNRVD
jgi:hypothetical protein